MNNNLQNLKEEIVIKYTSQDPFPHHITIKNDNEPT